MEQVLSPEIALARAADTLTLRLRGVVGIMGAAELYDAAIALTEHTGAVAIDATAVEHFDCSAAQILLALRGALGEGGRTAPLIGPAEGARGYLALAGLAEPLGLADLPRTPDPVRP